MAQPGRGNDLVIVSLTSVKAGGLYDPACLLKGGEHPFITGPTYVFYRRAEHTTVPSLQAKVTRREVVVKPSASDALVRQIRAGAMESEFSDPWVIEALRECPWELDNPEP
jgi:hypothetical protein